MIALDTNVLIRLIIFDDPAQSGIADNLIRNNQVFISKGVLMESEWVLRYRYKFQREQIVAFVQSVLDASNTLIEDELEVRSALEWYSLGADLADALHLAACGTALMHTFDRDFCRRAQDAGVAPIVRVLEVK
ncbi:MAG: type II toxin-antitoxin system VapC family toxin [Candidatus Competibacteraceae bacterium]